MPSVDSILVVKSKQSLRFEENKHERGGRQCPAPLTCSFPGQKNVCFYKTEVCKLDCALFVITVELLCHIGGWTLGKAGNQVCVERVCAPEMSVRPGCLSWHGDVVVGGGGGYQTQ